MFRFIFLLIILGNISSLKAEELKNGEEAEFSLGLSKETKVKIVIKTSDFPDSMSNVKAAIWGGNDQASPKTRIELITGSFGKTKITVPYSAYADLASPHKATLAAINKNDFVVYIKGGDASVSYDASLTFKDGLLVSRSVRHGEFPAQIWEYTVYSLEGIPDL